METTSIYSDFQKKTIGSLFIILGMLIIAVAILSTLNSITGRSISPSLALYLPVSLAILIWTPLLFFLKGKARVAAVIHIGYILANLILGTDLRLGHILIMLFLSLPCWLILAHSPELPFMQIPAALMAGSSIIFSLILFSILEHNLHVIFRVLFRMCDLAEIIAGGLMIGKSVQWICGSLPDETEEYPPGEIEEEPTTL
ncbi:MAG: hypothetical protein LUF04_12185 [Bacteroides sp.]|nr:hypothetical protein [Bacteroides sp.]